MNLFAKRKKAFLLIPASLLYLTPLLSQQDTGVNRPLKPFEPDIPERYKPKPEPKPKPDSFLVITFYEEPEVTLEKARKGDAESQYRIGVRYYNGEEVEQDWVEAADWIKKSAAQGYAKAQFALSILYRDGDGVPADNQLFLEWLKKSVENGHAKAQFMLGGMHYIGDGVATDKAKAFSLFKKSARQGYSDAQTALGLAYFYGNYVPKNMDTSAYWLEKAAKARDEKALELWFSGYFRKYREDE